MMAEHTPGLDKTITVVSGMPRSGTSMLMQMLEAAGLEIHLDGARVADLDNPKGYFELEATKRLAQDASFLERSCGKVVKVVAPLLASLPTGYAYRVIFIERDMQEVMASQRVMMERGGRNVGSDAVEGALARALEKRVEEAKSWLDHSMNLRVCYVSHAGLIESPMNVSVCMADFLRETGAMPAGVWSEAERQAALSRMASVVDRKLYRQRQGSKD